MNRRDALKSLSLSLGYVIATPTILSMFQSCTAEADKWKPLFYSDKQGQVLQHIVDLILPKTKDTPGALDVNVPQFMDLYISKTASDEQKEIYITGMDAVMEELGVMNDETLALKTEDYDALLSKYLRLTRAQRLAYVEDENLVFATLMNIRNESIFAYTTSREIGKNVLAYDPIPGKQKGCISLEEATGGKAWSL